MSLKALVPSKTRAGDDLRLDPHVNGDNQEEAYEHSMK